MSGVANKEFGKHTPAIKNITKNINKIDFFIILSFKSEYSLTI